MKVEYIKDLSGNELLQDITGTHQLMMEWEKPYMEKCIEKLDPSGGVLEFGFGLAYSATKLCSYKNVTSYTVIECSPIVWEKFEQFKDKIHETRPDLILNIIKGRWQDVLDTTGNYDTIFFDADSIEPFPKISDRETSLFLYECLFNHTNVGSKIGLYSANNYFYNLDCITMECTEYDIEIPEHCQYASGNKMYIPIITKIAECEENLREKLFPSNNIEKKIENQVIKTTNLNQTRSIYCNLLVIDDFYNNAMDTRNYILTQDFKVRGNYPGQRTESYANEHLKTMIEGYIAHFAGKITCWPTEKDDKNYNGAFQYTTSSDHSWIHNDGWNNWAGVLYMTPNAPVSAGTGIYRYKDGTRTAIEAEARGNKAILDQHSQDYTKWELVDNIGNVFNRLVLFNSTQYHASQEYFRENKENGRLFQVFFFNTEK